MRFIAKAVFGTCLLASALSFAAQAQPSAGEIPLTFHPRISENAFGPNDATLWPTTFGVPFPQGALPPEGNVRLLSEAGEEIPAQAQITAAWPDGSVRWVLVDAQAPLGGAPEAYRLEWGEGVAAPLAPEQRVQVFDSETAVSLYTGVLRIALSKRDMRVFLSAESRAADGSWASVFPDGETGEILVEDVDGKRHLGSLAPAPEVTVEEAGPMRATVKLEGWTQAEDGAKLGRHIVRVQAFAGQRRLRVYHTFVKTADSEEVQYRNISLHVPFQGRAYRFAGAGMDAPREAGGGDYILQHKHDEFVRVAGGERAYTGKHAPGMVSVSEGETAYTVTRRHFREMFPSEFEVGEGTLNLHFWPRHGRPPEHLGENLTMENLGHLWWVHEGETLDFRAPEEALADEFRDITANIRGLAVANAMGVARTLDYQLDFHGDGDPSHAADAFRANPLMVVNPDWLAASGAFWNISARSEHYAEVEDAFEKTLLFLPAMYERIGDYGLWNYGAYHQTYHPSLEFAWLHRIWKGFHHGGPRWPWLNFARSGNPAVFDFAEIHSRHLMDVSVCNWEDPEYNRKYWNDERWWGGNMRLKFLGGLCRYNGIVHWDAGMRMFYNSQVDFALWHYYMTGYRRAWDVAMNMGEFLLRIDDAGHFFTQPDNIAPEAFPGAGEGYPPTFHSRSGMARGTMALSLYRATHDERYRELAERQMRRFMKYADEDPDAAGAGEIYYAPFVERYWELLGDEGLAPYIVRWAQVRSRLGPWAEEVPGSAKWKHVGHMDFGLWDGKGPGRSWHGRDQFYNLMALGYQLTGDADFLRRGLAEARVLLENLGANADPILDGVLVANYAGGPGYAAQQWGHFVRVLDDHYERTGERLRLNDTPDALPFSVVFRSPRGRRHEDGSRYHRLVFHTRKAEGEEVSIRFPFRTNNTVEAEVQAPDGTVFKRSEKSPENRWVEFAVNLAADDPAGDYRIEFYCPPPLRHDLLTSWPLPGNYRKLVVEMPLGVIRTGRFYFMPQGGEADGGAEIRLRTEIRHRRYHTHRIYRPGGEPALAITEQGRVTGRLNEPFPVPAQDRGQLWLYSGSSFGRGDAAWLEGDVHPAVSFAPEEFFVPERFK